MHVRSRTVFGIGVCILAFLLNGSDASIVRKAKLVRVIRDGTPFERYTEKGKVIPALPTDEEEVEDLNDPRIGHLDKDGGLSVPVDENGRVLKDDTYNIPNAPQNGEQQDYKPYPNNQDLSPKAEFLPEGQETAGEEYDDVEKEPNESVPDVPGLPKLDYTDSGESDEDLKTDDAVDDGETNVDGGDEELKRTDIEVIIPSSKIELAISRDEVDESNKSADEVEKEVQTGNQDDGNSEQSSDLPKNRDRIDTDSAVEEVGEPEKNNDNVEEVNESGNVILDEDENIEDNVELARDFGKAIYENVMIKAKEIDEIETESEVQDSDVGDVDPNAINVESEIADSPEESVVDADNLDGVVLPDQTLTDEEIAKIADESLKPIQPADPETPSKPVVRGGRIGSGVQPDSATQHNILLQFITISLILLFV
ncbi:Dentin sialophosphoprotein-like [Caenorhabditis elegans]|uniref:Dentin sialophosphoprotein-like n=1 Tax=Caenorhabditis elegans TaxID=6239 RepID=I2HAJ8_CAEEL|nr:Dentin sialophosphoprotein-like [Caenorhabditis elegans]CCH63926.1 Dentin sialophosphoprotein-like [Caenorhabditis elegans]|eukprot:NP_001263765.1 Uncharacterized protein CELE_F56D5.6 [Caenorhabditis elegans]